MIFHGEWCIEIYYAKYNQVTFIFKRYLKLNVDYLFMKVINMLKSNTDFFYNISIYYQNCTN